ncbi:DUF2332 domain-containing protein [Streptomyces sp. NPDC050625]|uniref:DUF2332 domain-containing protein n=1 Tax=Streptomyces sp. NPDC050625 TaxID=3154629 RepID=UPI00344152E5
MIPDSRVQELRRMAAAMGPDMSMSASMLTRLTDDIVARGPIGQLISNHPDACEPLFGLRALAGVRWLVLTGRAPHLAAHLQHLTPNLGNSVYIERTWTLFRQALLTHPAEILAAMDRPVQQHQPQRAGALLRGLGMLRAPRIRLLELGACAGLNLLLDRYRWFGPGWEWGDANSPVRLTTTGPAPGDFGIVDRAGCDLVPRNAADPQDATILRSFLPHERDVEQMDLDDAIALASRTGLRIDKADAIDWLVAKLSAANDEPGLLTVVWHSLFWSYLPPDKQAAINRILAMTSRRIQLARVAFEPDSWSGAPRLQVHVYS